MQIVRNYHLQIPRNYLLSSITNFQKSKHFKFKMSTTSPFFKIKDKHGFLNQIPYYWTPSDHPVHTVRSNFQRDTGENLILYYFDCPGAGKTSIFRETALETENALYLRIEPDNAIFAEMNRKMGILLEGNNQTDTGLMKKLAPYSFTFLGSLWKNTIKEIEKLQISTTQSEIKKNKGIEIELTGTYTPPPSPTKFPEMKKDEEPEMKKDEHMQNQKSEQNLKELKSMAENPENDCFQFEHRYRELLNAHLMKNGFSAFVIHFDEIQVFASPRSFERPEEGERDSKIGKGPLGGYKLLSLCDAIKKASTNIKFKFCLSGTQVSTAQRLRFPTHFKSDEIQPLPWTAVQSTNVIEHFLDMSHVEKDYKQSLYKKLGLPRVVEYFLRICSERLGSVPAADVSGKVIEEKILPQVEEKFANYIDGGKDSFKVPDEVCCFPILSNV